MNIQNHEDRFGSAKFALNAELSPEIRVLKSRFEEHFGEGTASFPPHVRLTVYARMIHTFHPSSTRKEIRRHFLMGFHPDTGTSALSDPEKCQVFATGDELFARVKEEADA